MCIRDSLFDRRRSRGGGFLENDLKAFRSLTKFVHMIGGLLCADRVNSFTSHFSPNIPHRGIEIKNEFPPGLSTPAILSRVIRGSCPDRHRSPYKGRFLARSRPFVHVLKTIATEEGAIALF